MPEGDTLYKTAARLGPALAGHLVTRFEAPRLRGDRPALGTLVEAVEARGKHLLVHFADGLTLRTHLRMTGSWHVYRQEERWQRPAHLARVVVGTDSGWVGVCFSAPVVETYHRGLGAPDPLVSLGPDLCLLDRADSAALDEVVARVAQLAEPGTTLGDALLDQRIAAGVGNVYKSEACFACGIDPGTPIDELDDSMRRQVWTTAAQQLQANLTHAERRTHSRGLAVYGRQGEPCHRCGTPIRMAHQGAHARSSYWCPCCQRHPPAR